MVLEELRVFHLDPQAAEGSTGSQEECLIHTRQSLSMGGDFKAHPHSDALPLTRPHFLIVPLPMG